MLHINFYNDYNSEYDYLLEEYQAVGNLALNVMKLDKDFEISVTLVDNEQIKQINKDYREKDYATDVISFESEMYKEEYLDEIDLGDIFISVDKGLEQAQEYGHSKERELSFLFVHGLLHCLGYDHLDLEQEKEMFALQEVILSEYKRQQEQ